MMTPNDRDLEKSRKTGDVSQHVSVAGGDPNGPVERIEDPDLAGPPSKGHHVNDREDIVTAETPMEELEAGQASTSGRGVTLPPDETLKKGRAGDQGVEGKA